LNVYRAQYGLPPCGAGCFTKVSQTGSTTNLPAEDAGWAEESALDEDMVSAICPNCNILMVEANSASFANLAAAAQEAAALGANEISNSYGGSEYTATNAAYSYPNIVVTASSGDDGYSGGVIQPCSYASVVCTGGTTLSTAGTTRGYSEVVWNELRFGEGATGSGCSAIVSKPSWQNDTGCKTRTESDVAFDADPETGVAVYDSTSYEGYAGWLVFGGTSVSSPSIASVYALAGNASALGSNAAAPLWSTRGSGINSVTTGFNTLGLINRCPILYVCVAGTNADGVYSGPAGWGTPNGITLF
jgi:subtilase family serine protease